MPKLNQRSRRMLAAALAGRRNRRRQEPRHDGAPAMRLLDDEIEYDRRQEHQPLHRAYPGALESRGDEPRLDHHHDQASEHRPDDRRPSSEDRRAADEDGRYGEEQITLSLVAEIVSVLEREKDRGQRRERA